MASLSLIDRVLQSLAGLELRQLGRGDLDLFTSARIAALRLRALRDAEGTKSDQAHLILGVRSYPIDHPDRYALQVLATVLGGGMSSRLFLEVRERRGLAYYVHGVNNSYTDAGSLYAQAGVDINRIDEAVTTIVDQLKRLADEAVPEDELERARSFTKGRFVLQLENPQGVILFGLRREALEGEATEPDEVLAAIDAVTTADLQRVAQDLVGGGALNLAVIGPFEDSERFEKLLAA